MIDTEVMSTLVCDYLGPLHGWALTAAGKPRYVFLGVDMTSDYTFTNVSNTCNDDATLEALKKIRNILGGLPRRITADNALFTPQSKSLEFLWIGVRVEMPVKSGKTDTDASING